MQNGSLIDCIGGRMWKGRTDKRGSEWRTFRNDQGFHQFAVRRPTTFGWKASSLWSINHGEQKHQEWAWALKDQEDQPRKLDQDSQSKLPDIV